MKNLAVIEPPRPPAQADRDGAVHGQESAILGRILADDVDLALWERHLDPRVAQEIAAIDLDTVDDLLLTCEAAKVEEQLRALLLDSGYPPCPALVADVAMLAALHARLLGEQRVTIRLEVVETDACRKFHADFVTVRTITTSAAARNGCVEAKTRFTNWRPGRWGCSRDGLPTANRPSCTAHRPSQIRAKPALCWLSIPLRAAKYLFTGSVPHCATNGAPRAIITPGPGYLRKSETL
ncbi:MAG: DUF1826 domain-containing protein [Novosphingobium pentaromativorans]|uniref:DUF1826 domain-containing protein n=1 Tax=Novosphingobium pentaromativorans TaxID=205844 RepID=A0A2W5QZ54_9SPHN|nr:DUF1826 domain-containing protein [Novosphingobium panipatense]PZQ56630.1 MAG: DUF1826 domain-containing protein [Novosphingobium pentaromativorans]